MPTPEEQFQQWLDSQSGYVGRENKANWWGEYNTGVDNKSRMESIANGGEAPKFSVSGGSVNEQQGRIEGLERAKILTGQNSYEIGKDYQDAYGNIKKRATSSDTGAELLRANKAGAVADARNQLQSQEVKGGAALGAVSQVERAKSYDINNQLQQRERQAQADYLNAVKSNANFTQASEMNFGQMAAGKDVKAPSTNSSGLGTVICTELFMQGYFDIETMEKDFFYGRRIRREKPHVYVGYRFLADPVVRKMKKSKSFTTVIAFFGVPWSENMAGKKNFFGKCISVIGEALCGTIGKIIMMGEKYANQKA